MLASPDLKHPQQSLKQKQLVAGIEAQLNIPPGIDKDRLDALIGSMVSQGVTNMGDFQAAVAVIAKQSQENKQNVALDAGLLAGAAAGTAGKAAASDVASHLALESLLDGIVSSIGDLCGMHFKNRGEREFFVGTVRETSNNMDRLFNHNKQLGRTATELTLAVGGALGNHDVKKQREMTRRAEKNLEGLKPEERENILHNAQQGKIDNGTITLLSAREGEPHPDRPKIEELSHSVQHHFEQMRGSNGFQTLLSKVGSGEAAKSLADYQPQHGDFRRITPAADTLAAVRPRTLVAAAP